MPSQSRRKSPGSPMASKRGRDLRFERVRMTAEHWSQGPREGNEAAAWGQGNGREFWAGGGAAEMGRGHQAKGEEVMVGGLGGPYDGQPEPHCPHPTLRPLSSPAFGTPLPPDFPDQLL